MGSMNDLNCIFKDYLGFWVESWRGLRVDVGELEWLKGLRSGVLAA